MTLSKKDKKQLIRDGIDFGIEELGFSKSASHLKTLQGLPLYTLYNCDGEVDYSSFRPLIVAQSIEEQLGGSDTLIYKSFANENGISRSMLKFSPEPIIQVLYHEMFHNINNFYSENESYADAVGFFAAKEFSKQDSRLDLDILIQSEETFNQISSQIKDFVLTGISNNKVSLFEQTIQNFDDYHHQRFNYGINDAFLARCSEYCSDYTIAREKLDERGVKSFLNKPKNESEMKFDDSSIDWDYYGI